MQRRQVKAEGCPLDLAQMRSLVTLVKAGAVGWWEQNPQCSGVRMWVGPGKEDQRAVAEGGPGPRRLGFVLR